MVFFVKSASIQSASADSTCARVCVCVRVKFTFNETSTGKSYVCFESRATKSFSNDCICCTYALNKQQKSTRNCRLSTQSFIRFEFFNDVQTCRCTKTINQINYLLFIIDISWCVTSFLFDVFNCILYGHSLNHLEREKMHTPRHVHNLPRATHTCIT